MSLRVARLEAGDVLGPVAERSVGLRNDLVRPAEAVEVIDVERAKINLHGLEEILERHALLFGFDTIDVCIELRHVDGEGRKHTPQAGSLVALADNSLHRLIKRIVTKVCSVLDV